MTERLHVQVLAEVAGEFPSPESAFCDDSYFGPEGWRGLGWGRGERGGGGR